MREWLIWMELYNFKILVYFFFWERTFCLNIDWLFISWKKQKRQGKKNVHLL